MDDEQEAVHVKGWLKDGPTREQQWEWARQDRQVIRWTFRLAVLTLLATVAGLWMMLD